MNRFEKRLTAVHRAIGIAEEYEAAYGLPLQIEARDLTDIGMDVFGRPQQLRPEAAGAWQVMRRCAEEDGVVLQVVSAFRSIERQTAIIQRKLDSGQTLEEILSVCAAPGYSEHHSGLAVDITTTGCEPLAAAFEATDAFRWLKGLARSFGFSLSYPKGNRFGVSYEPWHWAYRGLSV
jgi:D-alanyl-D-alanine carboxypeptidase